MWPEQSKTFEYIFFSRKGDSRIANIHLSVCLSEIKTPLTSDHQAYQPSALSTIGPFDHRAYWPSGLSTIGPIDNWVYWPSSPLTIKPINLSSSFVTFKPFDLFIFHCFWLMFGGNNDDLVHCENLFTFLPLPCPPFIRLVRTRLLLPQPGTSVLA